MADNEKLTGLIQKREVINARIRQEQNKEKARKRKEDTRRKILVGAAMISEAGKRPQVKEFLQALLGSFLTKPEDRALFGLPPLPPAPDKGQ